MNDFKSYNGGSNGGGNPNHDPKTGRFTFGKGGKARGDKEERDTTDSNRREQAKKEVASLQERVVKTRAKMAEVYGKLLDAQFLGKETDKLPKLQKEYDAYSKELKDLWKEVEKKESELNGFKAHEN